MAPPQGAAGDDTAFELRVNVHDGRHFPLQSFEVRGVFDNEVVRTGVSRASTSPSWDRTLVWRRSSECVRKMQSQGAKLKLTGAFSLFSSEDKQPFFNCPRTPVLTRARPFPVIPQSPTTISVSDTWCSISAP